MYFRNGLSVPLQESVFQLTTDVLKDLELNEEKKTLVKFYTSFGFDPFHGGSTQLSDGGIVGLPVNFSYNTIADFNQSGLAVGVPTIYSNLC